MEMKRVGMIIILFGALVLGAYAEAGNLYRWKDSEGNPVMSDRPPPTGVEYETISTSSNLVHSVNDADAPPADSPSIPAGKPPEPEQTAAKSGKSKSGLYEKNPEYCAAARKNLEVIDRAPRIRMDTGDGELRYLTDEERAAQRQNNLEVIEAHCE